MDPATEPSVAQIKLAWWMEEVGRLAGGSPLHPITRYLAQFANAPATDWSLLARSAAAAFAHAAGAPLERASELSAHAEALYAAPLLAATQLGGVAGRSEPTCVAALAPALYLADAAADHRRAARSGRIAFAVEELLAAGVGNEDLAADRPPPHLDSYLTEVRSRAHAYFVEASAALLPHERPPLRHLPVLAALGANHLADRNAPSDADFRLADLYNAWNTARRAAAGR
jgi:phytoene synthase